MSVVVQIPTRESRAPRQGQTGHVRASTPLTRQMLAMAEVHELMVSAVLAQYQKPAGWRSVGSVVEGVVAELRYELPGRRARRGR